MSDGQRQFAPIAHRLVRHAPAYLHSQWALAGGTNSIYTTGSNSAEISGSASAVYYYAGSASNTSQITLAPSGATIGYEKLACVRVSSGIPGYCVGFSAASGGNYTACYVMKNFKYLAAEIAGTVSATASHTLTLSRLGHPLSPCPSMWMESLREPSRIAPALYRGWLGIWIAGGWHARRQHCERMAGLHRQFDGVHAYPSPSQHIQPGAKSTDEPQDIVC